MRRAVIFDFDGLLVDTETPEFEAWQEIYAQHGCVLHFSAWAACIGTSVDAFDPVAYLEQQAGVPVDRERVLSEHLKAFHELAYAEPLMPGVETSIAEAKRLGIFVAISSSAKREWIESHLKPKGILEEFDCIKTQEDVGRVKPDPELYLSVLDDLGVSPRRAIALEDSTNGIRAARRAGIYAIAVPNPTTKRLSMDGANEILDSLEDLDLEESFQRVRESRIGDLS